MLKTGHALSGKFVTDFVCREGKIYTLSAPRVPENGASHGTGCTLSSALAAGFALEMPWKQAVCEAKAFVTGSLRESVPIAPDLNAMYPPVEDHINTVPAGEALTSDEAIPDFSHMGFIGSGRGGGTGRRCS